MNKEFSNIIIFNNYDIEYVKNKIEKILIDLDFNITSDETKTQIDIIQDKINNICIITSKYFEFVNSDTNKSIVRKISKRVAQDTFMVTSKEKFAVVEKYSFNKRIYDYICFGDKEELESSGYKEAYGKYLHEEIWKNHFVGRNTIKDVKEILDKSNTYFNEYEILVEILKLYGIKFELSTYKLNDELYSHDIVKETIYFE